MRESQHFNDRLARTLIETWQEEDERMERRLRRLEMARVVVIFSAAAIAAFLAGYGILQ